MVVQPGLCGTWSETPKTSFLTTRLICDNLPFETVFAGFEGWTLVLILFTLIRVHRLHERFRLSGVIMGIANRDVVQ